MYRWDPSARFHNAVWSGTLALDGPCVYVEVSQQSGSESVFTDAPLRSFLRLPQALTSFDAVAGELWVGDYGPMVSGDEIVLVGSQGWQIEWNVNEDDGMQHFAYDWERQQGCPAHVSFWAASMMPAVSTSVESLAAALQPAPVVTLFDWDIEREQNAEGPSGGVLLVEEPCLYLDGFSHSGQDWQPWDDRLYLLYLPRPLVRFDSHSDSVWVGDNGPMTSGDEVLLLQVGLHESARGSESFEGACIANGTFHSTAMWPRHKRLLPVTSNPW